jgi:hypothetical protein
MPTSCVETRGIRFSPLAPVLRGEGPGVRGSGFEKSIPSSLSTGAKGEYYLSLA